MIRSTQIPLCSSSNHSGRRYESSRCIGDEEWRRISTGAFSTISSLFTAFSYKYTRICSTRIYSIIFQLHFTLVNLTTQQMIPITHPLDVVSFFLHENNQHLLFQAHDYICTIREDAPELIVMANPGLQVWSLFLFTVWSLIYQVWCLAMDVLVPTQPIEYFRVRKG